MVGGGGGAGGAEPSCWGRGCAPTWSQGFRGSPEGRCGLKGPVTFEPSELQPVALVSKSVPSQGLPPALLRCHLSGDL